VLTRLKAWTRPDTFHTVLSERGVRWYNACLRITRDADLAADAVQEALLKAWDRRDEFRGESELDTWIHRIALNAAIDQMRRRKPQTLTDELDAERLMEHMGAVGGWYIEDREIEISAKRVMKIIESTNDPRSEYYDLMRREAMPADELMGRRMEIGVVAVLGQLRAKRNWHRIMREWIYADSPSTPLGEEEWEYFEGRGVMQRPIVERAMEGDGL